MTSRAELLRRLAEFREPPGPLLEQLRTFPFDLLGDPLLVLTKEHFLSIFDRYLNGELSESQVQDWAEHLECRDDVSFDSDAVEVLVDIQCWLANPGINGGISPDIIRTMRARVEGGV